MSGRRAGCPGLPEAPDVRARTPDVRAGGLNFCGSWCEAPDFRGFGRMSGLDAGCPGPGDLADLAVGDGEAPGAGCPGLGPDVRGLEGDLVRFSWFSSSAEWVACPSSRASLGGSS